MYIFIHMHIYKYISIHVPGLAGPLVHKCWDKNKILYIYIYIYFLIFGTPQSALGVVADAADTDDWLRSAASRC